MRLHNFSGGPSALPLSVLERSKEAVLEYGKEGVGLFELGHRTKAFLKILDELKEDLTALLGIPEGYDILLCPGGASLQFSMIPYNLGVGPDSKQKNYYLISGHWAKLAMQEANSLLGASVAGTSEECGFKTLPVVTENLSDAAYLHYTSNNTIYGTQTRSEPEGIPANVPLVCDTSSDILSRPMDVSKYSLIYAGAQKNMGTAGVALVILKRGLARELTAGVPKLLRYDTYLENNSLYNTPPVSAIFVMREMLRWTREQGTLESIAKTNEIKARIIYDVLDKSGLYQGYASPEARSYMNITFTLSDHFLEEGFLSFMKSHGVIGLAGHRSVGGFRISLYNAIELVEVEMLAGLMREFERKPSGA